MRNYMVIENIYSFPTWDKLLHHALELADRFCVIYPDGEYDEENSLLNGKPEFEQLANLKIDSWSGMKDASVYSGELTEQTRILIKKYLDTAPDALTGSLWNCSLVSKGTELLNVQDFNVCLVKAETELKIYLEGTQVIRAEYME